jgi:hypothetical protein
MKQLLQLFFVVSLFLNTTAQPKDSLQSLYTRSYDSLNVLLAENRQASFKKAVFITENCFTNNQMEFDKFDSHIHDLAAIIQIWQKTNPLINYRFSDSNNLQKNLGIYKLLKDTITFLDGDQKLYKLLPYAYDFTDFFGKNDWGYMFVTKLLATKSGNCHSLPYLYKILADEINATCWLTLAPNHIYISNRCKKIGWYNTELTSGDFPVDAWIMASGYLPLKAVQKGIYMDTLSNQQSIALCVLDLAKEYEHQTKNYFDGFIIKCCDLSLKYFPLNVQAMLLRAETLKRVYEKQANENNKQAKIIYHQMEELYAKLFDLGYREMPEKMYMKWLQSVVKERNKYSNRALKETVQGTSK